MPKFGTTSLSRLYTCEPRLIMLFSKVVEIVDCTVICGYRNEAEQNEAYANNKSKVMFPNSKHNRIPSMAIDVAPYYPGTKIRWEDAKGFIHFAGVVRGIASEVNVPIRWGGDWDGDFDLLDQEFNDLPHFELRL